ncbi:MAD2L1-binding protein-like [Vespa velutina]|uniref:MAD2L1-binding protein-like n=1 Tax=Vespa crabro TaxID=7445 RepID=UPI001EFF6CDB|nr:MAD2L1-binding protein-like [Vespa crabro]XP_047366002.1 MAD2L1-binding protein-like [Vespa velutina]
MFSNIRKCETDINVILDEHLTSDSCTKLIIEFIKYVLYQKQQIPFTYDSLVHLQARTKKSDRNSSFIKTLLNSLTNVSDHLSSELLLKDCEVKEILIIVGPTIISPKLQITLELPTHILDSLCHIECKHSSQKPLLNLMRSMMECTEFQDAMTLPLGPTNTFLLLQKSHNNSISNFFLPKPHYIPSIQTSQTFRIKLLYNNQLDIDCNCRNLVKVYRELTNPCKNDSTMQCEKQSNEQIVQAPFLWYQSREVIKGFKYVR